MFGELVPQGGGDLIPLLKTKLLVGRRESCDISLRFPNVSSHHCELEMVDGWWRVKDLNSSNGVKVNGIRVAQKFILPGDELSVAKHRFKVSYTPQSGSPPPLEDAEDLGVGLLEKAGLERGHGGFDDDDTRPSLLEKAGLEKKRERPSSSPAPKAKVAPTNGSAKKAASLEDEALKWLLGDDDSE